MSEKCKKNAFFSSGTQLIPWSSSFPLLFTVTSLNLFLFFMLHKAH